MKLQQKNAHERTKRRKGVAKYKITAELREAVAVRPAVGTDIAELQARVDDQLNRLSEKLIKTMNAPDTGTGSEVARDAARSAAAVQQLQERIRLLGQLAAGLVMIDPSSLPVRGAGYGSTVVGEEVYSGRRHEYTLMVGTLIDIDAGQVSLASPVGQALLGSEPGDVVEIELPHHRLRLRILSVTTLSDVLQQNDVAGIGA